MSNLVFEGMTIRNFKSFTGKHVFHLGCKPGLYYMAGKNEVDPDLGANGVGKSTLWDALLWVLYGKTGRDSRPGSSIEPWAGERTVKVALHLSINDKGLTIARSRNPNSLTVTYAGRATTPITVTQDEIDRILGMTESMFRCSVVLSQFGTLFLDLRGEQQSQMFTDALQLDQWLKASANASEAKRGIAATIAKSEWTLAKAEGRLIEIKKQMHEERVSAKDFERDQAERINERKYLIKATVADLHELPDAAAIIHQQEANLEVLTKARLKVEVGYHTSLELIHQLNDAMGRHRKAIRLNKLLCPECGQSVKKEHLEGKIEELNKAYQTTVAAKDGFFKELAKQDKLVQDKRSEINAQQLILNKRIALESDLKAHKKMLEELNKTKNLHRQKADALKVSFNELSAAIAEMQINIADRIKQMGMAQYWADAFKEIRLNLIDQVLGELSLSATAHAESLGLEGWRIAFATEKESKSGNLTASFHVLLYPNGQEAAIRFEAYSGGESQRLQLAIAFGLSEIVLARAGVEINMEALDEPTRGLSSEGVDALLEHLSERAQSLNRATFVVEHHSLERGLFTETLLVCKTDKGSQLQVGGPDA